MKVFLAYFTLSQTYNFKCTDVVFFLHFEHLSEAEQIREIRRVIKAVRGRGMQPIK